MDQGSAWGESGCSKVQSESGRISTEHDLIMGPIIMGPIIMGPIIMGHGIFFFPLGRPEIIMGLIIFFMPSRRHQRFKVTAYRSKPSLYSAFHAHLSVNETSPISISDEANSISGTAS